MKLNGNSNAADSGTNFSLPISVEMKVQQLLRNSEEPFEPQSANVTSLEELLELPWIKLMAQYDAKFYRFSCNRMDDDWLLVADLHGTWRVMALVSGDDAKHIIDSLPIWTLPKSRST
jgi:hypothetical protein